MHMNENVHQTYMIRTLIWASWKPVLLLLVVKTAYWVQTQTVYKIYHIFKTSSVIGWCRRPLSRSTWRQPYFLLLFAYLSLFNSCVSFRERDFVYMANIFCCICLPRWRESDLNRIISLIASFVVLCVISPIIFQVFIITKYVRNFPT